MKSRASVRPGTNFRSVSRHEGSWGPTGQTAHLRHLPPLLFNPVCSGMINTRRSGRKKGSQAFLCAEHKPKDAVAQSWEHLKV